MIDIGDFNRHRAITSERFCGQHLRLRVIVTASAVDGIRIRVGVTVCEWFWWWGHSPFCLGLFSLRHLSLNGRIEFRF